MTRGKESRFAVGAAALALTALLAACSTLVEDSLVADLIASTDTVALEAEVGASVSGSFQITNDENRRTRYTVSEPAPWLSVTSGSKGNLKAGRSKTVSLLATCSEVGSFQADVTVLPTVGTTATVTVMLECTGGGEPPPPPPPPPAGDFKITLVFGANITEAQQADFQAAADRWAQLITGDVPDIFLNKGAGACGQGEPAFTGTVDDVVIYAEIEPIDGEFGVLGSAGPCFIRSDGKLPVYGTMRFDSADVGSLGSQFEEVILHEMGHVIGIGTIWDTLGLLSYKRGNCQRSNTVSFTGAVAKAEYAALGGNGNVPVEDDFGPGTKCGHWDEAVFGNELMTGFLNGGVVNPLSRVTVGSLGDLGYQVDLGAADPYGLPGGGNLQGQGRLLDFDEEILTPIGVVGEDGAVLQAD